MARGARSPFDLKIPKPRQKALARQLRRALAAAPLDMQGIIEALDVQPEAVVIILRRLRGSRRGRLHSAIRFGHVAWWWEPDPGRQGKGSKPGKAGGGGKKGDRRPRVPAAGLAPEPAGERAGVRLAGEPHAPEGAAWFP